MGLRDAYLRIKDMVSVDQQSFLFDSWIFEQKRMKAAEVAPQIARPSVVDKVYALTPIAQNYEWGRFGRESEVAKLQEAAGQPVDVAKPYAELWMGTHPSGPSTISDGNGDNVQLLAFIRDHPEVLGAAGAKFGVDLPFMFKVLSVRTALSIQSHPDKPLAERLHAQQPQIYKDSNHKPEMTVALSEFKALCGFCPHEEIVEALQHVPELRECCGEAAAEAYITSTTDDRKQALKTAFTALMTANADVVRDALAGMVARLQALPDQDLSPKERLVLLLNEQYPGDVGVFAAWFLNYVTLQRGQAIALAANEPHAYLSGEIMECMATSDNVIRAGLTPKLRDTDTLCESLTYSQGVPPVMNGQVDEKRHLVLYRPPFDEFEVWRFGPPNGATVDLPASKGPLVMIIQQGSASLQAGANKTAQKVSRGQVFFIPANLEMKISGSDDLVAWIAAPNGMGF